MNRAVLARNLLILTQLRQTAAILQQYRLPVIALKGAALICAFPEYAAERVMEDIDLLVRPDDLAGIRELLLSAGYRPAAKDPGALRHPRWPAALDISGSLWYLTKEENASLWKEGNLVPLEDMAQGVYRLSADDLYVHILVHAAVHHARRDPRWMRDLELLRMQGGICDEKVNARLSACGLAAPAKIFLDGKSDLRPVSLAYRWLLRGRHPERGHVARFLYMPLRRKRSYLSGVLFPPDDFLRTRYSLSSARAVRLYRVLRPFLLAAKLFSLAFGKSGALRPRGRFIERSVTP